MDLSASTNWLSTVYVLGAVQGVFLAAVLASRRHNAIPNRLLAAAMLVFSLDLGAAVYHASGYYRTFPHLIGLDYPLTLLYGPLFYLYVRTLSGAERSFRRRYGWHMVPFALLVLYLVPFYVQTGAEKLAFLSDPGLTAYGPVLAVVSHLKVGHALIYVVLIVLLLRRHRERIRNTLSSVEHVTLIWLRNLSIAVVAIAAVASALYLLAARGTPPVMGLDANQAYGDYKLLATTLFVYAIGYIGLRQSEIFAPPKHAARLGGAGLLTAMESGDGQGSGTPLLEMEEESAAQDKPRYARSGMDTETAMRYVQALRDLMETEKPYRRSDLTLQDLAATLAISPHNLTEVLNTQLEQNFYDFVNTYRVRDVQERLKDPVSSNLTLLAIGLDAGFNSKSSFNSVFKKHTRMTPSQYRDLAATPS